MEQESQKKGVEEIDHEPNAPILCANNCGFFGSAATNNFCSKCYKDFLLKQSKTSLDAVVVESKVGDVDKALENLSQVEGEVQEAKPSQVEEGTTSENPQKQPTNRCNFCRKKVGFTGFKCRCGHTFCSVHRYSDKHNCAYDYKGAGQDAIAKANPIVKADKIEKI